MSITHPVLFEICRSPGMQMSKHFIDNSFLKAEVGLSVNLNLMSRLLIAFCFVLFSSLFSQVQFLQ